MELDRAQAPTDKWPIRRLPVIITLGTLAAGAGMIIGSAWLDARQHWVANLLLELGGTTALFAPLLGLTALFGRKVVASERRRDARVAEITDDVEAVRQDVDRLLANITQAAIDRIAADRAADEECIAALVRQPTSAVLAQSLRLGHHRHFTSERGPRVTVYDTRLFARFNVDADHDDQVNVTVESSNGTPLRTLAWTSRESAEDLGYNLGRTLEELDHYPGDIAFQAGRIFSELHQLLDIGYRAATGAGGLVAPVGPIMQLTGDKWAITDVSITTTELPPYKITLDRLHELDWDAHLRGRDRIDIGGFRQAHDTAIELIANGCLTPPAPRDSPAIDI